MVVYVNAHGTICGRSIRFSPEDGGEIALQAALVRKGLRCGFELSANDGRESAQLHGSARLRGRTLSGNAYIHRNGVALTKTDLSAVLRGLIRLELEATVRPAEGLAAALSLPADTAKDVQELALTVRGDNLGGLPMGSLEVLRGSETALSLSLDRQQLAAAALPSQAEGQSLEEWRSGIKLPGLFGSGSFETIFENLKNAGMPGELLTILKVALPRLLK